MWGGGGKATSRRLSLVSNAVLSHTRRMQVALPGFYPASRAVFVPCAPTKACVGGVNASESVAAPSGRRLAGCGPNYSGVRCGDCRQGSYRRSGECHTCPNTAWLLFLSFALAIVAAVAAAVYLSKKRVNLAGLSVGVVRYGRK